MRKQQEEARKQNGLVREIMDRMGINIYVTDVETDEILFMNKHMRENFQLAEPEGQICWQVLQKNMDRRCDFCPIEFLEEGEAGHNSCIWEEHNTVTDAVYENYDGLMEWEDGRTVHFQCSVDITDSKRLYHTVSMDELTGLPNRRAGKEQLQQLLRICKKSGRLVTVCMFDINHLKQVNDEYGFLMGDKVIEHVVVRLKELLSEKDFMFRLSGDSFVIAFLDRGEREILGLIKKVRQSLKKNSLFPEQERGEEFSFGILQLWYQSVSRSQETAEDNVDDILWQLDEAVYAQKRENHILRATEQLNQPEGTGSAAAFEYDAARLYDALAASTDDYIYVCNMKTGVFRYSQAMVDEFDLPGQVIPNALAVWGSRIHEDDKKIFLESNQELLDNRGDSHLVEYRAKNKKGEWVWLRCRGHLERDEKNEPVLFAGIITNLGKKNTLDHITGLLNLYQFEEELENLMEPEKESQLAVLIFGMDNLKHINHLYDHLFGDEVIRIVSQKMQSLLPANGSLFRLDGDKFGVILRGGTEASAKAFFLKIKQAFYRQQSYDGKKFYCTLSCGCVLAPKDGSGYKQIIKNANYALENAKKHGKNRLSFFSQELLKEVERGLEMTEIVRESVEHGFAGFQVYCQPLFHMDRTLKGAEALLRFHCEKYGTVSPLHVVEAAEKSGLITDIGRFVLDEAVRQCKRYLETDKDFVIHVNVSYIQLGETDFFDFVKKTLKKHQVEPKHLVLELTESCVSENMDLLREQMEAFRAYGLAVAIDDFGTGYSSLNVLKNMPADILKIDRAFIREIEKSSFDQSFVRLVVELCHTVGMKVCAEGLETEEQYAVLKELKLDTLQGFLLGKPVPMDEFLEKNCGKNG